jgi:hypothetical protein
LAFNFNITWRSAMKVFVSTAALAIAVALNGSAFAQDVKTAKTEADCNKAGGMWNAQSNECTEESAKMGKGEGTHEGAQATPEQDTQKVDQP